MERMEVWSYWGRFTNNNWGGDLELHPKYLEVSQRFFMKLSFKKCKEESFWIEICCQGFISVWGIHLNMILFYTVYAALFVQSHWGKELICKIPYYYQFQGNEIWRAWVTEKNICSTRLQLLVQNLCRESSWQGVNMRERPCVQSML